MKPRDPSTIPAITIEEEGKKRKVATIKEKEKVFLEQAFPS